MMSTSLFHYKFTHISESIDVLCCSWMGLLHKVIVTDYCYDGFLFSFVHLFVEKLWKWRSNTYMFLFNYRQILLKQHLKAWPSKFDSHKANAVAASISGLTCTVIDGWLMHVYVRVLRYYRKPPLQYAQLYFKKNGNSITIFSTHLYADNFSMLPMIRATFLIAEVWKFLLCNVL